MSARFCMTGLRFRISAKHKKDDLAWIDRLEEMDAALDDF